jgi:predicted ATP-grasp superfamily ATP-dependent carboligase
VVWNGALVAAVHQRYERRWPVDCGTASAAVTVEHDPSREAALLSLLGNHQGIFQAQYLGSWLIDLNPRPYGSMPLATKSGVNFPALVCSLAQGDIEVPREVQRGRTGVRYRWVEGDIRHLAARLRAGSIGPGEVVRALTPRHGTAHSDVSIRDPLPAMLRVRQILRGAMHRQR